jgi:membrane fusion protein, copper/silver efflux system
MNTRIADLPLFALALTLASALAAGTLVGGTLVGGTLVGGCAAPEKTPAAGHEPTGAGDEIAHYTCPMHASVQNAEAGSCPTCAMALVPVFRKELAGSSDTAGDEVAHYTCSMHPSVRNAEAGSCPTCAMALVPVLRSELASGEIVLDAGRRQQIGVTTARAERRTLAVPVRAVGKVTYDQTRLTDVTLKVGGWIDELYVDRLGQQVSQGEPLFTLSSSELFEAQQEFLAAANKQRMARMTGSAESTEFLAEARRQRLRLSDLSPDQIKDLELRRAPNELVEILSPASGHVIEKEVVAGSAIEPGVRLLRIAGLDRVWVEAEVYESELALLKVGTPATVTLPYLPGRRFNGRIAFVYPWLDGATRTGRVRIELGNPGLALKPEMYAEVLVERALGERLAVPEEAILYAGDRRYVFLDLGDGRLRPKAVTLGLWAGEWVEILDGLEAGDMVVTSGNFLIAAEARLKLALDHWAPEEAATEAGAQGAAPRPARHASGPAGAGSHTGHGERGGHDRHTGQGGPAAPPAPRR